MDLYLHIIRRALRLRAAIDAYCHRWQRRSQAYDLTADYLDDQDWEELHHFEELLRPFHTFTFISQGKASSGQGGALWEVLPTFNQLFNHLRARSVEVDEKPSIFTDHYGSALNAAFQKMKTTPSPTRRASIPGIGATPYGAMRMVH
jgi:hypothetical protein